VDDHQPTNLTNLNRKNTDHQRVEKRCTVEKRLIRIVADMGMR
jgi:hypothetical protein